MVFNDSCFGTKRLFPENYCNIFPPKIAPDSLLKLPGILQCSPQANNQLLTLFFRSLQILNENNDLFESLARVSSEGEQTNQENNLHGWNVMPLM